MSNTLKVACFGDILYEHNNIKQYIIKNLFSNSSGGNIYE